MITVDPFTWLTDMAKHHTGKLVPNSQTLASDMTDAPLWDQATYNPFPDAYYEGPEIDLNFDGSVRVWGDITSVLAPGESGVADPMYQIDYRADADTYDGFEDWVIGTVTLRYVKPRLHVDTSVGVPVITGMITTADSVERTETHTDETILAGGTIITFDQEFHTAPGIRLTVLAAAAINATFELRTTTTVKIHGWNAAGTDVGGTITVEAIGI